MGFFDDLGSVIGDFKSIGDDLVTSGKDVINDLTAVKDEVTEPIKQLGDDAIAIKDDITTTATDLKSSVDDATQS